LGFRRREIYLAFHRRKVRIWGTNFLFSKIFSNDLKNFKKIFFPFFKSKGIDLHGYQDSNQCTATVEANILCPTKTHPELAWARETPLNEKHYITSVQYTVFLLI